MKGQIFILASLAIAVAIFLSIPRFQQEIYFPNIEALQLENIAAQYNKWIAYASIEDYDILSFGNYVKQNFDNLEFIYLLAENKTLKIANFFDTEINCSVNGKNFTIPRNSSKETLFLGKIVFNSSFANFSYVPRNNYSGAIFLISNKGIVKSKLLKIFK